jgi:hypothetical protein
MQIFFCFKFGSEVPQLKSEDSSSSASGIDERSPASSNKLANQFAHCVVFKFRKCLCQTGSGKKQHGSIGSIHEIMRYANVLHGSLRFVCIFQRWTNLPKSSGNSSGEVVHKHASYLLFRR